MNKRSLDDREILDVRTTAHITYNSRASSSTSLIFSPPDPLFNLRRSRSPALADAARRAQGHQGESCRRSLLIRLYNPRVLQVDIWALGCMAYLLAFNRHAFPDGSALATLTGKYTIPPAHGRSQQVHLALNFPPFLSSPIFPACLISLPPAAHRRRRRLPCPQPQRTPVQ